MPKDHPPWAMYCVKGMVPSDVPGRHMDEKTVVGFRIHHSYGDGFSFCCALLPTVLQFKFVGEGSYGSNLGESIANSSSKQKLCVQRSCSTDSGHGTSLNGHLPSEESLDEPDDSTPPSPRGDSAESVDKFVVVELEDGQVQPSNTEDEGGDGQRATPSEREGEVNSKWTDFADMKAKWYQVALMWIIGSLTMPISILRCVSIMRFRRINEYKK
jgi:hypothetical protein